MRIDLYTKTILTLIALLLAVIAVQPLVHPTRTVQAQGSFNGVQFTGGPGGFWIFDSRSGDVWAYGTHGEPVQHYKIAALGQPLTR